MKDLSTMTAAELVAELARRRADRPTVALQNIDPWFINASEGVAEAKIAENERNWIESISAITAELDARCEKWRIGLNADGGLVMASSENAHIGQQAHGVAVVSDLSEFRALLGYLEQRGNDGSGLRILKNLADENLQRVMVDTKGGME